MKGKLLWSIFWALVGVFAIEMGMMFSGMMQNGYAIFAGMVVLFGLGVTLLVLTIKAKVGGLLKKFFLLSGASAMGLPVFAVLHNLVYGLLILWFGEGFWGAGGDEPVFFIMATMVCPLGFVVGAIGSIVLGVRKSPSRRR